MKTLFKTFLTCGLIASGLVFFSGCDDDDDDPGPQLTGDSETYTLLPVSNPAISGTVTFAERDDDQIMITIQLTGTQSGNTHPAHIHANSAAAGGPIVLDLTSVNGADGKSETIVNALNDGTALTYDDLLNFDGYVNVHLTESDLGTLIAQGDIGGNELTGDKKEYTLTPVADPAVTGIATFEKRKKGTTLVTVALTGTQAGETHPSHIHENTIAEGGGIVIDLSAVDGATGRAVSSVDSLNDGTPITYEELLDFNGYLNVHTGSTFVVQGDIGQNELTGDEKVYTLNELNESGVSGTATFAKRVNGLTLITLALEGTVEGGDHPSHIHANNAATGGGIVLDFNNVNGATGMSTTSVRALNDGTAITYDELLTYNGYINVHLSPTNLGVLIAQGDMGSNAP
ncbi:MAG TPA: CHRD domain-containing protein [Chryseosolibacter sp.]